MPYVTLLFTPHNRYFPTKPPETMTTIGDTTGEQDQRLLSELQRIWATWSAVGMIPDNKDEWSEDVQHMHDEIQKLQAVLNLRTHMGWK